MTLAQTLPNTQADAQRESEYWRTNLELAQVKFEVARRELRQAQDDLDIVKLIAAGDFETELDGYGYVMSSRGPWCLGGQR